VLTQPCNALTGVGPSLSAKLKQCGIHTLQDLLLHLPFRYQDRTRITAICDVRANDWCVITGQVNNIHVSYGKRKTLTCNLEDKTGIIMLRFFHFNPSQVTKLREKPFIRAFGEIRSFANAPEIIHPEYRILNDDDTCAVEETLTPIYTTTQGLGQARLRQLVNLALDQCRPMLHALEWMNDIQLTQQNLPPLADALEQLHNPPPDLALISLEKGTHPGLKRLAFDELIAKRLSLEFARQERNTLLAPACPLNPLELARLLKTLPFRLTHAQQRVHEEIGHDLMQTTPMLRLVQGDVGSGKTVIAALAAMQVIARGHQVALMAPTDLLTEQHALTLSAWFSPLGIQVGRLSGKMKMKDRRIVLNGLREHTCHLLVGTHALFQDHVEFSQLGLIIIDEQHRFGVEQRLLLQQKGQKNNTVPHQLMMTATPIPRTLAMTHFAHLDLSMIDELPPGRTPIKTAIIHQAKRDAMIARLQAGLAEGRQAYWVCTLIDESENLQCTAATVSATALQTQLPQARIGLVHGRMKGPEKEAIMRAFKAGAIDLLVATTVIEVGVDVPNASLMIIENAERLGLSQLHQLRGRVGRGSTQSHCLLLYQGPLSRTATERLQLLRETTDGFIIAEKDLILRGAGQVLGTQQTGYRPYKIAALPRDEALLPAVAAMASHLLNKDIPMAHQLTKRWLGDFESFFQV
jgi:ATP-dependent DNA helicase RecG